VERVRAYRMTLRRFIVYLGVELDLVARGLPNTSWFLWGSYDIEGVYRGLEEGRMPGEDFVYVTVASLKDPHNPRLAPPGYANLQVMTMVPRDYARWHVAPGDLAAGAYHRDPEYRRLKAELGERLIRSAERVIPGLADHVDWQETATPVTQERFTHSTGGTSYGIEFATDQMGPLRIGPASEIPGLYLCGASTPSGHGIGSVLRSGVAAAGAILGRNLLRALARGETLGDASLLPPLRDDWDPWRTSH